MIVKKEELKPYLEVKSDLIPLHIWNKQTKRKGKTQQRGKTPLYGSWTKTPYNPELALEKAKKDHNVGYRLGPTDIIVDCDPRNYGLDDSYELLCKFVGADLISNYPTVVTGSGGLHIYMTKPEGFKTREIDKKFPGIEFKTQGRQVVAAGSKHPNGKYYLWDEFSPSLKEVKQAPKKLLKFLKRENQTKQAEAGILTPEELERLLEQLPVEEYKDHDEWFKVLCSSHHATNGAGINEFLDWCTLDDDYADDDQLIKLRWESLSDKPSSITINTLYKEVLAHGGTTATATASEDFKDFSEGKHESDDDDDYSDITSEPEINKGYKAGIATKLANELHSASSEEDIIKALRASLQAGTIEQVKAIRIIQTQLGITKGELNEILKEVKERIVEDLGRILAEKTVEKKFYNGKGIVFNYNGEFWAYNGKHWEPITKQYVGRKVTEVLDKLRDNVEIKVKENAIVTEALGIIERITSVREDALRMRKRPHPVINCNNGELWIKSDGTAKLRKHRPESYLLQVINTDYTPGAECPIFDKAIRETFSGFDDTEDMVRHFEEFMGYILHPDKRPAHWWLLKGPGGDGKSTLLKIIGAMLGDAVMPESIERFKTGMSGDKHAFAELVGKLLVYDDDLDRNTTLPDGTLKKLSEDGEITANPKGTKGFKFTKVCTVAMLSNGYPATKDITRGTRRRAQVIPFNKGFHENGAVLDLAEQIINKELAGVMNRALEGLQRLRERGEFLEPNSCKVAKDEWLHQSNPVALFIHERVERTGNPRDHVKLGDAYGEYLDWCAGYNVKGIGTKQQFRSSMEDLDIVYGKGGGNANVFRGIKLVEEFENDFDNLEAEDDEFDDFDDL